MSFAHLKAVIFISLLIPLFYIQVDASSEPICRHFMGCDICWLFSKIRTYCYKLGLIMICGRYV